MWPVSRARTLFTVVVLVMLAASPAWGRNTIEPSGGKFRVVVKIDLFHDDPGLADTWREAITDVWNDGPGLGRRWKYCGRPVEFVPDIQVHPQGAKGRPDAHKIRVKLLPPGRDITSTVRWSSTDFDPGGNSSGVWGSNETEDTIAHEFGHLLGLRDEYEVISENPRRTRPLPGFEGSLMAGSGGTVNQGLIDKAMIANKANCDLWSGVMHSVATVSGVQTCTAPWTTEFSLQVDPEGNVTGTARTSPDVAVAECSGPGLPATLISDIAWGVQGTKEEDSFTLQLSFSGGDADGSLGADVNCPAACYDSGMLAHLEFPLEVSLTSDTTAEASITESLQFGGSVTIEDEITLTCDNCEAEAVG